MFFNIELPDRVATQIKKHALFIAQDKPSVALGWYEEIYDKINSLNSFPLRCPLAPENKHLSFGIRHLIIGTSRILFYVDGETVVVVVDFKGGGQNKPEKII